MKQNDTVIVKMEAAHVSQVAQLEQICFSDPWPEDSISSELDNPLSLWLVAFAEEQVVGYIGSQAVLGEADIMNVAVDPAYRRQGIAEQLLLRLEQDLKDEDVHSLTLEVRPSNTPAVSLYEKLGYKQVGCRRGYYHYPKEDALILRKEWEL